MRWGRTPVGRHVSVALGLLTIATAVVAVWAPPAPQRALAVPNLVISQSVPANTLIGSETSVEVTVENTGDTTAFNLLLLARLPVGIHVTAGDRAPTETIEETDAAGEIVATVVAWEDIVDIRPGGLFRLRYTVSHDVGADEGQWTVGDTFPLEGHGYANSTDSIRPQVAPSGTANPVTAVVTGFTQTAESTGSTTLVPLLPTKSEPSIESELLRGVHDHQTVYTLSAVTGTLPGVRIGLLEDWIPAGIEFLGCGEFDNSADEEYPGSGPLNPGNAPALTTDCFQPVLVETVSSGLPPGLPGGVYTHVVWDISADLPTSSEVSVSYVAGIPQRQNTTSWPSGTPDPGSGLQASNIDNNTGPLTTQEGDGTTWTNQVQAQATFDGDDITVEATETVQAVDVAIHKSVGNPTIGQGEVSEWELLIRTSEYVVDGGVAGLALTDVTPDGTCPIGSVNTDCTVGEPLPVAALLRLGARAGPRPDDAGVGPVHRDTRAERVPRRDVLHAGAHRVRQRRAGVDERQLDQ